MATYYKYAEREADSQINWEEISKNLSDTLTEANNLREQKKTAIDESTRAFSKTLANATQGENGLVNQKTLDYAENATQLMLIQERLLKSGQMKFKDYATVRQNLIDSTDQAFGLAKEYQEEYSKKMQRLESGVSSGLESWEMEQLEGYANLSGMNFYLDPTTGNVSMAKVLKKEIDGQTVDVMDEDPNNYVNVNTARNRLKSYHDKFKVEESLQEAAKMLGKNKEDVIKAGGSFKAGQIITTSDPTQKKDLDGAINLYNKAEENFISSRLSNDYNVQSVLYDHEKYDPATGEAYRYSFDPKDQGSNVILMKTENGRTVVDTSGKYYKEQYGVAEKYMQQQLRSMLDREVSRDTYQEPSNYTPEYILNRQDAAKGEKQKKTESANMLGMLYYGDTKDITAAAAYFQQRDPNIKEIYRWNNVIKVVREEKDPKDGSITRTTTESIPLRDKNGVALSQKEFIQAASPRLAGINDIFTGLDEGSYIQGKTISTASPEEGISIKRTSSDDQGSGSKPNLTAEQWNTKWETLKKGQTMVGLDGKTYTKQ
jgi:hypothetical protein